MRKWIVQFVDRIENGVNELWHMEFQNVFGDCVRKSGMGDVICPLTRSDRTGVGCLLKPDAIPNVFFGRKAMQEMTDDLAKFPLRPDCP